jgi:putative oxidoreductase
MEEPVLSWVLLVGRTCLALLYLVSGVHKAVYFDKAIREFRAARAPALVPTLTATIVLHIVASTALIAGVFVRESALALALFTVLATYRVHDFWNRTGEEKLVQSRFALAHLAVIGGLVILAAVGPGQLVLLG